MNRQICYKYHLFHHKFSLIILLLATLIGFSLCIEENYGGKEILLFIPGGTYSHKLGVWSLVTALADKGHKITVLSSHPKSPSTHPNITSVVPKVLSDFVSDTYNVDRFEDRRLGREGEFWTKYIEIIIKTCKILLDPKSRSDSHYSKFLDAKFDLIIINAVYGDCGYIFAQHYKTKYMIYHSALRNFWYVDTFGLPIESAWLPELMPVFNHPFTMWDKIVNLYIPLYWKYTRDVYFLPVMETLMKEHLQLNYTPYYDEWERNAKLVLYNGHYTTDFARSLPPSFIPIGGMSLWAPEKPIPDLFKSFLDASRENGAVLISFGSSVELSSVPDYYKFIFLNLIKKLNKINFILKWKGKLPENYEKPNNLLYSDWLPQKEILRHQNLKAFITHGGLNSIQEATYYGVPLIVLPLFADQDFNAYRVTAQEIGLRIEIREINPTIFEKSLMSILTDRKYRDNMIIRSEMFKDRQNSPIDTAVYWTEFVLRHNDTESLKPPTASLTWYQKRLWDVYLVLFAAITIIFLIMCTISIKVLKMILKSFNLYGKRVVKCKGKRKQN